MFLSILIGLSEERNKIRYHGVRNTSFTHYKKNRHTRWSLNRPYLTVSTTLLFLRNSMQKHVEAKQKCIAAFKREIADFEIKSPIRLEQELSELSGQPLFVESISSDGTKTYDLTREGRLLPKFISQQVADARQLENLDIPELAMIYGYIQNGVLTHDRDKLFRIEKDFGTLKQIDDNTASRWLNPSLYYTEETNEQCENKRVPGQVRTQVTDEMKDMEVISSFSDFDICSIGQFLNLDDRDNGMIFRTFVDAEK